jgi:hypothetical protein
VYQDFYSTIAQVMPVLLLALMWDSGFLRQLATQDRPSRKIDPNGVRWWTKPRVRVYVLTVATLMITTIGVAIAVLAGLLPDSRPLRAALTGALVLALATLLTRVSVDVLAATARAVKVEERAPAPDSPTVRPVVETVRPIVEPVRPIVEPVRPVVESESELNS